MNDLAETKSEADDLTKLMTGIGAALKPLAEQQAQATIVAEQERTIRERNQLDIADKEAERRHTREMADMRNHAAQARNHALIIAGVVIAAFMAAFIRDQWLMVTHLGTAAIGAFGGYGYARRQSQQQNR